MSSSVFEEEEAAGEKITQYHVRDAIERLDFEEAGRLHRTIQNQNDDNLDNEISIYSSQQELLIDNAKMKAQREELNVDIRIETKISDQVSEFYNKFLNLKQIQQQEMDNLKSSWEEQHNLSESIARKKIDDILHTSKVLATCECFDEAAVLRDSIQYTEDEFIAKECEPLDMRFKKQFMAMNERHNAEMKSLYNQMENNLRIIEGESNIEKTAIKANRAIEEAKSPIKTIRKISAQNYTPSQKRTLISHVSPMKAPVGFSKMNPTLQNSQKVYR